MTEPRYGKLKYALNGVYSGGTPTAGDDRLYGSDGVPFVTIGDMSKGVPIKFTERRVTEAGLRHKNLRVLRPGTVVVSMYATIGLPNILDIDAAISQAILALFPRPSVDHRFLYYWLTHVRDQLRSDVAGSTQGNLNAEKIRNVPFRFIDPSAQQRIADFLDRNTARIDELIGKKKRLVEVLEEQREAYISRAVIEGLAPGKALRDTNSPYVPRIPEGWSLVRLKQIARVHGGIALGRALPEGTTTISAPYLRVANVQAGWLDLSDVASISVTEAELERYRLREGDVLMLEGGDNDKLGRGAVWTGEIEPCVHQNHVFAVRPNNKADGEWISLCSNSRYGRDFFFLNSRQSTNLASISKSRLEQFPVPLPPLEDRVMLVRKLKAHGERADLAIRAVKQSIDKLQELRSALITAAVTGRIDVETWRRRGEMERHIDEVEAEVAGA